jgi:hypothetical protein
MDIIDYPQYLIYRDGKVWSKRKNKYLKPATHRKGYLYVVLYNDINKKIKKIHRLVAINYIPNPHNYPQVDHINRNKKDNRVENLRWVNQSMNQLNTGMRINKSGHKYITFRSNRNKWMFLMRNNYILKTKVCNSKIEALCFKFYYMIKLKSLSNI